MRSLIETDPAIGTAKSDAKAAALVDDVVAHLARIKLLFGEESETARVAKDLAAELDLVRNVAADPRREGKWEALEKVYVLHASFNDAALAAVHRD